VTLLEKGPKETIRYPDLQFLKKKFAEVHTCCYGSGGSTNLWHNGLIPIRDEDVVGSEFREVLQQADPFIDQAAAALFYTGTSFTKDHRQLVNETNTLSPDIKAFTNGIDCLVYPKHYKPLKVSPDVRAVYDVSDIDFILENERIVAVRYSVNNQEKIVQADIVIIAAGTLGTPGLLQKILKQADFAGEGIGKGFIDHPMGFVGKVKVKNQYSYLFKTLSAWDRGDYVSRNAVRLKSACGRYTACAFLRAALTMDNRLSIYKYKSSLGASNGFARFKNIFSWKIFHPDIIAEIFAHLFGFNLPSRTYNILFIGEQKRSENRVHEEDGRILVDWSISEEELSIYRDMLGDLKRMLSGLADEININLELTNDWLWSAAHHSGTTSLGPNDDDLLDSDLRLKCYDNVYVCDGSVLQEHSYANTGLAIGQLAFRLADHLISRGPTQTTSDS